MDRGCHPGGVSDEVAESLWIFLVLEPRAQRDAKEEKRTEHQGWIKLGVFEVQISSYMFRTQEGPCFNCGKTDHWAAECPSEKKPVIGKGI